MLLSVGGEAATTAVAMVTTGDDNGNCDDKDEEWEKRMKKQLGLFQKLFSFPDGWQH